MDSGGDRRYFDPLRMELGIAPGDSQMKTNKNYSWTRVSSRKFLNVSRWNKWAMTARVISDNGD